MGSREGASGEPLGLMALAAVAAISLSLFMLTTARVVMWGDSAKLTLMAMDLELLPNPGGHPGYVLLAGILVRLVPGDPALVLNLFSGLCGGLTVAVLARLTSEVAGKFGGIGAAASLVVAHLFWHSATMAESYTPAALCLSLTFLFALWYSRRPSLLLLTGICFLISFGTSINAVVGILSPGALVLLWRRPGDLSRGKEMSWGWIPLGLVALLLGFSPYLVAAALQGELTELPLAWLQEAVGYFSVSEILREGLRYPLYLLYQFPSPAILLLVPGIWFTCRRNAVLGAAILTGWMLDVLFGAAWLRERQFMVFSVGLLFPAFLAGVGAQGLFQVWEHRRPGAGSQRVLDRHPTLLRLTLAFTLILMPVGLYLATPPLTEKLGMELTGVRPLSYRPPSFFLQPWKSGRRGTQSFSTDLFDLVGPGDRVVADFTLYRVLSYYQRMGKGEGVLLFNPGPCLQRGDSRPMIDWIQVGLDRGARVFLADDHPVFYFLEELGMAFSLNSEGGVVRVWPRAAGQESVQAGFLATRPTPEQNRSSS